MSDTQLQQLDRDELEQRVRELEETVDNMALRLDAFSRQFDNLRDLLLPHPECPDDDLGDADTIVELIQDTEDNLSESLESHKKQDGTRHSQLAKRISAAEDALDINADHCNPLSDGGSDAQLSRLDRAVRYGVESVADHPTPTMRRATTIGEHITEWGDSGWKSDGDVRLASSRDNVKSLLEAARAETLQWSQVYRAMELVNEWSGSGISLQDGDDHEGNYVLTYRVDQS
jgi:hypothetical protein